MSYTVTLELPDGAMTLADCGDGDRPRQAPCAPDQPKATSYVAGSGFIGGRPFLLSAVRMARHPLLLERSRENFGWPVPCFVSAENVE